MILYHLDRKNTFPSDTDKQLLYPVSTNNTIEANYLFQTMYSHGISKTGERYLNTFTVQTTTLEQAKQTCKDFRIHTIEYVFEMVRLLKFSHLPSRFTFLFACKTPQDIKSWYEILKGNAMDTSYASVKIIETNGITFYADANWRDQPLTLKLDNIELPVFNPFAYHEWAYGYWSGSHTKTPFMEVLCELPVRVIDNIPFPEFSSRFMQ